MSEQWIGYKFPSLKAANNFVAELSAGHALWGQNYVRSWAQPKRKKGGYWVAVYTARFDKIDALAAYFAGERLSLKAEANRAAKAATP